MDASTPSQPRVLYAGQDRRESVVTARPDLPVPCPECKLLQFYVRRDPKTSTVTVECASCGHVLFESQGTEA